MSKNDTGAQLGNLMAPLGVELDTTHLLGLCVDNATRLLGAERSTLFLLDETTQELWSKIAQGLTITEIRMPRAAGIAGHVATTGEALNLPDAYECPHFNPEWDQHTGYLTRSVLCMPLHDPRGTIVGVIEVLNKRSGPFSAEDERVLAGLCSQAAILVGALKVEQR